MTTPQRPPKRKTYRAPIDFHMKVIIIFILLCVILGAVTIFLIFESAEFRQQKYNAWEACIKSGFPEVIIINETAFCHRIKNATDEIIPVEWAERSQK